MSDFKFDDEIETSDHENFKEWGPARFVADKRDSSNYINGRTNRHIIGIDKDGDVIVCKYARIAPPRTLIDGVNCCCTKKQEDRINALKQELQAEYDIITGDV
jgi:hypothetical protein